MKTFVISLKRSGVVALGLFLVATTAFSATTYQHPADFVDAAFAHSPPKPKLLWLTGKVQKQVEHILGHRYPSLRLRYWQKEHQSVWILEETGKEQPITTGFEIVDRKIKQIKILVYRESRGSEVRNNFFTDQFKGRQLNANHNLDGNIDGISGATLSVRAIKKLARVALLLDQHVSR